jgi:hypothetical protein
MVKNKQPEEPEEIIGRALAVLAEHFDVVQIFAQIDNSERTETFNGGLGNMLARQKQIESWIENDWHNDDEDEEDDE